MRIIQLGSNSFAIPDGELSFSLAEDYSGVTYRVTVPNQEEYFYLYPKKDILFCLTFL